MHTQNRCIAADALLHAGHKLSAQRHPRGMHECNSSNNSLHTLACALCNVHSVSAVAALPPTEPVVAIAMQALAASGGTTSTYRSEELNQQCGTSSGKHSGITTHMSCHSCHTHSVAGCPLLGTQHAQCARPCTTSGSAAGVKTNSSAKLCTC